MSFVVTGATGHLGRLTVESLLRRGVPAAEIVATGRDTSRIGDLADRGVRVRHVDYDDPATLRAAFSAGDRVLFVSGTEVGRRVPQHRAVVDALRDAEVALAAYTSVSNADRSQLGLAAEHLATEQALAAAGVPFVALRNSWYVENYTGQFATFLEHGVILGSAGEGLVSAATRADYAEAAAAVLLADDQTGKVYELGADQPFTMAELADAISAAAGRAVVYKDLSPEEHVQALIEAGVPDAFAAVVAEFDAATARGDLLVDSGDLSRLVGRAPTSMPDAVRAAVEAARG